MPLNITPETPRKARTIGGVLISVPQPYAAGHVVTEGEAQMLNQTLAENFSNNLRDKIAKFVPAGEYSDSNPAPEARVASAEEAQALVDEYSTKYEPGVRQGGGGGGSRVLDPVEKEMRTIASDKLLALLKEQGIKRSEVDFTDLRDQIILDHRDALRAQAEKIIKQREKSQDGIDLSGLTVAKTAPAEAPAA